jgi:hypothetical protein
MQISIDEHALDLGVDFARTDVARIDRKILSLGQALFQMVI